MANIVTHAAGDPWGGTVRQLILVHTDHVFAESPDGDDPKEGSRLILGSPLYVEQLTPGGRTFPREYADRP